MQDLLFSGVTTFNSLSADFESKLMLRSGLKVCKCAYTISGSREVESPDCRVQFVPADVQLWPLLFFCDRAEYGLTLPQEKFPRWTKQASQHTRACLCPLGLATPARRHLVVSKSSISCFRAENAEQAENHEKLLLFLPRAIENMTQMTKTKDFSSLGMIWALFLW